MSRVFVVQRNDTRMDLRPAQAFGDIQFIVPKDVSVFRTKDLVRVIEDGLSDFDYDDYLIPVGNPTIIGMVFAVLAQSHIKPSEYSGLIEFNVLHWTARERQYVPLKFSL